MLAKLVKTIKALFYKKPKRRGLVAAAINRQGIKAKVNNKEFNCLSGQRFENDF